MKSTTTLPVNLPLAKAQALKAEVMQVLQITEMQYCWFQYRQGLQYLKHTLHPDQYAVSYLERDRMYWNWFKNKWMQNDQAFIILLPLDAGTQSIATLRRDYRNLQSGLSIAAHNPIERFLIAPIYKKYKLARQ